MLQPSVHSKIRQASRGSYDDPPASPAFYVEPIGVAQVHGYVWGCHCISSVMLFEVVETLLDIWREILA